MSQFCCTSFQRLGLALTICLQPDDGRATEIGRRGALEDIGYDRRWEKRVARNGSRASPQDQGNHSFVASRPPSFRIVAETASQPSDDGQAMAATPIARYQERRLSWAIAPGTSAGRDARIKAPRCSHISPMPRPSFREGQNSCLKVLFVMNWSTTFALCPVLACSRRYGKWAGDFGPSEMTGRQACPSTG